MTCFYLPTFSYENGYKTIIKALTSLWSATGALSAALLILGERVAWHRDSTKHKDRLMTVLKLSVPGICFWRFENITVHIFYFYAVLDLPTHNTLSASWIAPKPLCAGS